MLAHQAEGQQRSVCDVSHALYARCCVTWTNWESSINGSGRFSNASSYVRIVELGKIEPGETRPPVTISGVPINVGPQLWDRLWSRLDAAVCTSATLSVFGQEFDFFLESCWPGAFTSCNCNQPEDARHQRTAASFRLSRAGAADAAKRLACAA